LTNTEQQNLVPDILEFSYYITEALQVEALRRTILHISDYEERLHTLMQYFPDLTRLLPQQTPKSVCEFVTLYDIDDSPIKKTVESGEEGSLESSVRHEMGIVALSLCETPGELLTEMMTAQGDKKERSNYSVLAAFCYVISEMNNPEADTGLLNYAVATSGHEKLSTLVQTHLQKHI
jgi:hypothetical protein